nr:YceI family protein [uncultured Desulfobacter sp.]
MKSLFTFILVLFCLFITTPLFAAQAWTLDAVHSGIYFSVNHIFVPAKGFFNDYDADIRFDPQDLASGSFSMEIAVKSIFTNDAKRDKHLLSKDFFNARDYPKISFKSSRMEKVSDTLYHLKGTMTMKGVSKQITIPVTFHGVKDHPSQKGTQVAGLSGKFTVDRLAYNVGDGRFADLGIVGKDVDVELEIMLLK